MDRATQLIIRSMVAASGVAVIWFSAPLVPALIVRWRQVSCCMHAEAD